MDNERYEQYKTLCCKFPGYQVSRNLRGDLAVLKSFPKAQDPQVKTWQINLSHLAPSPENFEAVIFLPVESIVVQ